MAEAVDVNQEAQQRVAKLKGELDRQIGRGVAALVALAAPAIAVVCAWLQDRSASTSIPRRSPA
jgi:hypothetical protein